MSSLYNLKRGHSALSKEAEVLYKNHKYLEAAKIYLDLAKAEEEPSQKIVFIGKAADAYHQMCAFDEEVECLLTLGRLREGEERINCIVSAWRVYIMAIAIFQYETGFEWKGNPENLTDSYDETITNYFDKAVSILKTALKQDAIDREVLLEKLGNECAKRENEGAWGADHCWQSESRPPSWPGISPRPAITGAP